LLEYENLTSYETESIKSECAYLINLEPIPCNAPADYQPAVIKHSQPVTRQDLDKLFTLIDLEEAVDVHEENLEDNIEKQS